MTDKHEPSTTPGDPMADAGNGEEQNLQSRRDFLIGLGNWSRAVIVGAVAGGALLANNPAQAAWINRRGGGVRLQLNRCNHRADQGCSDLGG